MEDTEWRPVEGLAEMGWRTLNGGQWSGIGREGWRTLRWRPVEGLAERGEGYRMTWRRLEEGAEVGDWIDLGGGGGAGAGGRLRAQVWKD
ncbi:unnamed protein product [Staurois parvus]|uniref:Uncharacterized protein n=1 Tax=Staurois parvus TaxID=386267 RepID=A0ABN9GDD2_9NEOB|nr:unnamed protein product [Staurois parvus]